MDVKTEKDLEFGGPAGNIAIMAGLPAVVYYLYFCVRFNHGDLIPGGAIDYSPFSGFIDSITPTWQAALIFGAWFLFQALVPGEVVGLDDDGERLAGCGHARAGRDVVPDPLSRFGQPPACLGEAVEITLVHAAEVFHGFLNVLRLDDLGEGDGRHFSRGVAQDPAQFGDLVAKRCRYRRLLR